MTNEQNEVVVKAFRQNMKTLELIDESGEVTASTPLSSVGIINDRFEIDGVIYNVAGFTPNARERLDRMLSSSRASGQSYKGPVSATESLDTWGSALKVIGFLWGFVGLIAGVVIAFQSVEIGRRDKAYPFAEVGISLALSSVVVGVLMATFGVFAMAYAENNRP